MAYGEGLGNNSTNNLGQPLGASGGGMLSEPSAPWYSKLGSSIKDNPALYGSAAGGLLAKLFGGHQQSPMDAANPYFNQMGSTLQQYLSPYIQHGQEAYGHLMDLGGDYRNLISDPTSIMKQIGAGYQQSPGYQNTLNQAMVAAGNQAAAKGLLGTPLQRQQDQTIAANLANQDYNNYMQRALGQYQMGLQGEQGLEGGLYSQGRESAGDLASALASIQAAQAQMAAQQQEAQNQGDSSFWGKLGGAAMSALSSLL